MTGQVCGKLIVRSGNLAFVQNWGQSKVNGEGTGLTNSICRVPGKLASPELKSGLDQRWKFSFWYQS